jgi:polyhydroxyalkanoate synthesis regulator phasin
MMKDMLEKAFSLGLGLVMAGKEQIEKTVDEWVKKGEVSRAESRELADELIRKGEELRGQIETMARERLRELLRETPVATKDDIARLERRLEELERKIRDES